MMTKKGVLLIGIIGSALLFLPSILNQALSCYQVDWFFCGDSYGIIALSALSLLPVLLLSLITYRLKEEAFRAWWGFARWWVPVIIVITLLLENAPGGGGVGIGGSIQDSFTFMILFVLYAIFIIVALAKIALAYLWPKVRKDNDRDIPKSDLNKKMSVF